MFVGTQMMITTTPREADSSAKQESNSVHNIEKSYSKPSSSITSTPRSRLQDPRIVRVSRNFGGKDRHSKVCTVKGLRDRRVRLSVPTAIQLYDLQERLGLNQPSKVVDWLLNEAKHDIDELPPLQMPLENFGQSNDDQLYNTKDAVKMISSAGWEPSFGNLDKSKEVIGRDRVSVNQKANWNHGNEEERGGGGREEDVSRNRFFPRSSYYHSSIPGLLNNVVPYNSIYRLDPSIFSHSHFTPQTEDQPNNFNVVPMPSLSLQPGSQVLVCPTVTTEQRHFPSHVETNPADFDPKHINHVQMLSSTSQNPSNNPSSLKAFQLSMSPNLLQYSQNSSIGSRSSTDDHEFSPK